MFLIRDIYYSYNVEQGKFEDTTVATRSSKRRTDNTMTKSSRCVEKFKLTKKNLKLDKKHV